MNNIKIVVDSSCDLTQEFAKKHDIAIVPLSVNVNNIEFVDDYTLELDKLLYNIKLAPTEGKSSCPSPAAYLAAFNGHKNIIVITLSSNVSGSHNSAVLAKQMYEADVEGSSVYILDSHSASAGEVCLTHKLLDLLKEDLTFKQICEKIETIKNNTKTYFILDDMETLIKNGRIKGLKALLVEKLNLKVIMTQKEGFIVPHSTSRGLKKAISNMAKLVNKESKENKAKKLFISNVNASDKIKIFLEQLKDKDMYDTIEINTFSGLSAMYANNGGIVIAF